MIPTYLIGEPHLPLVSGQTLKSVIGMVFTTYGLKLSENDYKAGQVYRNTNGMLAFDLMGSGEDVITFVNKASKVEEVVTIAGDTPTLSFGSVNNRNWLARQILVYEKSQLNMFEGFNSGYVYDAMNATNDLGWQLSNILNLFSDNAIWMHSSFAEYSTAKFTLEYRGKAKDAPAALDLTVSDVDVAVINITSGKHQGLLCLYSPS